MKNVTTWMIGLALLALPACTPSDRQEMEDRASEGERGVEEDLRGAEQDIDEGATELRDDTEADLRGEREAIDRGEIQAAERREAELEAEQQRLDTDLEQREAEDRALGDPR